jgi:hypothetical protein
MTTVIAHLHVDAAGRVTGQVASAVPPGDYTTRLEIAQKIVEPGAGIADQLDWPVHDSGPWPAGLTLRREDIYDDDGR